VPDAVLKLMGAYLVFAFTGFVMILLFLEKIGAKADSEKPCLLVLFIFLNKYAVCEILLIILHAPHCFNVICNLQKASF